MTDAAAKVVPTWGYHPKHEPQIFHSVGGKLPEGWFDHPEKAAAARAKAEKSEKFGETGKPDAGKEPGEGGEPGKEPGEGKEAAEVE